MSGDRGQVSHSKGPSQALALEVEVHQVLVSEDQGLGVLVLQVVQHSVPSIPAPVHVGKGVLPSAEVAHFPCRPVNDTSRSEQTQQGCLLRTGRSIVDGMNHAKAL